MSNDDDIIDLSDADMMPMVGRVIHGGLPLESGLRALAEQTRSGKSRRALLQLSENLEQGMPLSEALRVSKAGLPRSMNALVEAGLETGHLDIVLQYWIEKSQRTMSLRQQIWIVLSYPMFLVWFGMLICGGILLRITPSFSKIFDDFGTELPDITAALVNLSAFMNVFSWQTWVIIALTVPLVVLMGAILGFSSRGHDWTTSIPLIGRVFQYAALADLCRLLALLAESGLSLPSALRFAGNAGDDRWVNRTCSMVADEIDQGTPPASVARVLGLPNALAQVFRNAKSERKFAEALRGLADIYAAQCLMTSQLINAIVVPFSVAIVIGFVVTTAIALFLPLIKLLNDLS